MSVAPSPSPPRRALPPEEPTVASLLALFRRSFGRRHLQCADARFVACELPVHADRARRLLPLGLTPSRPARATLFLVDYRRPAYSPPYLEAALLLHVRHPLGPGLHCCWIVVDDDTPMIYGRETLAYPKKMAQLRFDEAGDAVAASVERRGRTVITLHARRTAPLADPPPIFGAVTYNVGGIGQLPGVNPVWRFRLVETPREAWRVDVDLELGASPYDPIADLAAGPPEGGWMMVADIAGAAALFPVGLAGPRWLARTYAYRIH